MDRPETFLVISKRDNLFKKISKTGLEADKDRFQSARMALEKAISKKKKSYFQEKIKNKEKIKNNPNDSK